MSYILDALRRADAQREGDPARGIHAQPMSWASPPEGSRTGRWPLRIALAATAVVLLALAAWFMLPVDAPAPARPAAVAPVLQPPPELPIAVAPAAAIAGPSPAAAVFPPPPASLPPALNSARAGAPVDAVPIRRSTAPPGASSPATAASSAELPLPADGAGMPKLAITGGVYSEAPAQRMLIVNGQVLHEGAEAAPGVVLEQIRPNAAVLRFRGQRYTVSY